MPELVEVSDKVFSLLRKFGYDRSRLLLGYSDEFTRWLSEEFGVIDNVSIKNICYFIYIYRFMI